MYTVFTCRAKLGLGSNGDGVRARLTTLPLLVTSERWCGHVLRCDVLRMTDCAEVTVDIDRGVREVRCTSRQRGVVESMLDDLGNLVSDRGQVDETNIHPMP
jgi:hypothetical protein